MIKENLGLIPTRGGSKGLENKNIKPLEGKPLIGYAIESAQACADITKVLVTTDDDNIEAVAREFGAEVFRHPPELSEDGKPTFPVIQYVVRELISGGAAFELITTMRATTPLKTPEDISAAIKLLLDTNADSVVSLVADPTGHPIRLKTLDYDRRVVNMATGEEDAPLRRQDIPVVYRRNGAIYVTRTPIVLGGSLFGLDSRGYVMPKDRSININDEVDFICAATILKAKKMGRSDNLDADVDERTTEKTKRLPNVYHDVHEVVWKYIASDTYDKIANILKEHELSTNGTIRGIQTRIINAFNSTYNHEDFKFRTDPALKELRSYLVLNNQEHVADAISGWVQSAEDSLAILLTSLDEANISYVPHEQTYIQDGIIEIAGQPMEQFAAQKDYFGASLQLFGVESKYTRKLAEQAYRNGLNLNLQERELLNKAKIESWDVVDVITAVLLREQITKQFSPLTFQELKPGASVRNTKVRKNAAINDAYYLMGKVTAVVAELNRQEGDDVVVGLSDDPVSMFLDSAGKHLNQTQIDAVRKIALAHMSHGLNSGELTARLASSVRATLPRALMASFNVRSGVLHAGAVSECMRQTKEFLNSGKDPEEFLRALQNKGELVYGFGHRIHKTKASDGLDVLGKDPRVAFYIQAVQEGFPEESETIQKLIHYARTVRKLYPNMGANTDFGATVLFHTLGLSPNVASGFFTVFRTVGVSAQIVNELDVKGNSRRPPFGTVLPYEK